MSPPQRKPENPTPEEDDLYTPKGCKEAYEQLEVRCVGGVLTTLAGRGSDAHCAVRVMARRHAEGCVVGGWCCSQRECGGEGWRMGECSCDVSPTVFLTVHTSISRLCMVPLSTWVLQACLAEADRDWTKCQKGEKLIWRPSWYDGLIPYA